MKLVIAPDKRLRIATKSVKKITPELLKVTAEMIKMTEDFVDPEGVGLASTQVGRDERFFVAKLDDKFVSCFNPEIHSFGKKNKVFFEGCLSIPDVYGELKRPTSVNVSYRDETGKRIKRKLTGVNAWIFQHEMDHLNGALFIDKVLQQKGRVYKTVGKDRAGSDIFEEVAI